MLGAALAATVLAGFATPADASTAPSTAARAYLAIGTGPARAATGTAATRAATTAGASQPATGVPGRQVCGPPFINGDSRLGPVFLPHHGQIGRILRGYVPLGGLSGPRFLDRYRKADNTWRYPPDLGFAHSGGYINGRPLAFKMPLRVGKLIDRFGGPGGDFASDYGASYVGRALPPDNLNTFPADPAHLCSYHVYRVIKSFDVDAGPAASAFQQHGAGLQYFFNAAYVGAPPDKDGGASIQWLIDNHYLVPAD
jgi:Tuberculosis necrotizing toxin